jgi:hypothetical protein
MFSTYLLTEMIYPFCENVIVLHNRLAKEERIPIISSIPISLTEEQFNEHINPYLSKAKRGYVCSIPLYKIFNYILYRLHTGCQWERIPIEADPRDFQKREQLASCVLPLPQVEPGW